MFTLKVDTAPSLLLPNNTNNGFILITVATTGTRTYRITREKRGANSGLDYFDFLLDLGNLAQGTISTTGIPYSNNLFVSYSDMGVGNIQTGDSSLTARGLGAILAENPLSTLFAGEIFKLLYVSVGENDLVREIPAFINLQAEYYVSGLQRKVRFIYYTMIAGRPIYTGYLGNVSFVSQYGSLPLVDVIDTAKTVNVMTDSTGTIDYYIVRIDTTPNVIVTNGKSDGIPEVLGLSDSYTINGITYLLTTAGNGIMGIDFYAMLIVPPGLDPSITENNFNVEPSALISDYRFNKISDIEYKFRIWPKPTVASMDLRISFVGPAL